MKKSMFLTVFSILFFFINASAQSVVQVNFSNQSSCDVYTKIWMKNSSCSSLNTPFSQCYTVAGSGTPSYYAPSGYCIVSVDILDDDCSLGGSVMQTVDFCAPSLITGTFNNGCDDMYAFGSGNCCGANPDIRDIGLSVL